ncbi:MAG: LemA family protein [Ramlibacter sp.]
MSSSLVFWIAAAVTVFWMVGAYNRLVRLRSDANSAFAALDTELGRQVALVHACIPEDEAQPVTQFDGGSAFWAGLQGAAAQLAASLASARARPLDPERIAALGAAQEVLGMAWERAERDDAHDLAGARLPENVSGERAQLVRMTQVATENFNDAVGRYNAAIVQFPAILLAWLFGFQPGRGLRAR